MRFFRYSERRCELDANHIGFPALAGPNRITAEETLQTYNSFLYGRKKWCVFDYRKTRHCLFQLGHEWDGYVAPKPNFTTNISGWWGGTGMYVIDGGWMHYKINLAPMGEYDLARLDDFDLFFTRRKVWKRYGYQYLRMVIRQIGGELE